jgi:hypothetical protein
MAGETPNVFIVLDLDPEKANDKVACEARVEEKRREWARASSGIGKSALDAKKNLGMIPEIKRILADDQLRAQQAASARTERAAAGKERREQFQEALRVAEAKGFVLEAEIARWVKEFAGALTEREIRGAVHVSVRAADATPPRAPQLDPTRAKRIHEKLELLGQASLYTLLATVNPAIRANSSAADLLNAADLLYKQMLQQMNKDVQVQAKEEMAGEARAIFGKPEERAKYDETLRRAPMDALLERYAVACAPAKAISEQQAELFLQDARKLGWQLAAATQELRELARTRNFALSLPSGATLDTLAKQVRCGNPECHEMNDASRPNCKRCGQPLFISCPNCGNKVAADEASCPNAACGFPVGDRFLVTYLVGEADRMLSQQDLAGARTSLDEAIRLWAPRQPDPLRQRLDVLRAQLQREAEAQQRTSSQVKALLDGRQFVAARTLLSSLPATFAGRDASHRLAEERNREAQSYVRQALAPGVSADDNADLCTQALRVCSDYAEARDMLAKMPPAPPTNLVVTPSDRIVSLKWTPSATRNAGYVVVRKSGSQPVSAKDGQQIGKVAGYVYDDTQPVRGLPLYYAVYADREGVTSAAGAVASRSVLLLAEVDRLAHRVSDGAIDLTWQPPDNATRVSVVRKEGGVPRGPVDGIVLTPAESGHLVDRGLVNGRRYGYGVYCQFRDQDGTVLTSRGVTLEATPETPPQPVRTMAITTTATSAGFDVRLTWQAPGKGEVAVLKSPGEPTLHAGEVTPVDTLSRFGQVMQGERNSLTDHWSKPGVAYYLPLVLFQRMAYVGTAQRWVCIDDIRNLKVQNLGPTLRLQWEWPRDCNDALVAYDRTDWPQPGVRPSTSTLKVTRAEYERLGYSDLGASGSQDYYITVAAVVQYGGDTITGGGARTHLRLASMVTLEYDLRPPGRLFGAKHYRLALRTSAPVSLPVLVLRGKRLGLPMSKADGDLIYRSDGALEITRDLEIELPDRTYSPNTFGKLFLEDDAAYDAIKVFHPDREKLRLS